MAVLTFLFLLSFSRTSFPRIAMLPPLVLNFFLVFGPPLSFSGGVELCFSFPEPPFITHPGLRFFCRLLVKDFPPPSYPNRSFPLPSSSPIFYAFPPVFSKIPVILSHSFFDHNESVDSMLRFFWDLYNSCVTRG